jgi:clan AA aspartic protease
MITGTFNTDEAVIRLQVRGSRGRQQEIAAVIDTGYSSWLTMPPDLVTALRQRWHSFGRGVLADGSECSFDVYEARVMWDGRLRRIRVYEFDAAPLVGYCPAERLRVEGACAQRGQRHHQTDPRLASKA